MPHNVVCPRPQATTRPRSSHAAWPTWAQNLSRGATKPHRVGGILDYFWLGLSAAPPFSRSGPLEAKHENKFRLEPTRPAGLVGLIARTVNAHNVDHDQILSIHFAGPPDSFSMAMPGGLRLQPRELKTARACIHIMVRLVRPGDEDSSEGVSLRKAGTGCHCKWSSWHQALARSTYDGKPSLDYSTYRWPPARVIRTPWTSSHTVVVPLAEYWGMQLRRCRWLGSFCAQELGLTDHSRRNFTTCSFFLRLHRHHLHAELMGHLFRSEHVIVDRQNIRSPGYRGREPARSLPCGMWLDP